jgi:hypothetical protein
MFRNRETVLFLALVIFASSAASTAWSQGRGPGAAPAGANERGASAAREIPSPQTPANPPAAALSKNGDALKVTPNKVASEITENPGLAFKVQPLLPQGTTLEAASNGFKNPGQFVAALHVSENLGISFNQLKDKIVTDKNSLGDAIQALKPTVTKDQVNAEVKKAESQAKDDMKKS